VRHGEIGFDLEAGPELQVVEDFQVAGMGHREGHHVLHPGERHGQVAAGELLRDHLHDLGADVHLPDVLQLDLPLLGQDVEHLGVGQELQVHDDLL
jgi:hypothetical protein